MLLQNGYLQWNSKSSVITIAIQRRCSLQFWQRQLESRGNKSSHPAQFKDAAGEDRGWLLATDLHDPTSRCSITDCSAGRSVIESRARWSLMFRWGSGSKPLIYRRAASRGTVSKTLTHPGAPMRRNPSIYWSGEDHPAVSVFGARVVTDVETYIRVEANPEDVD
ncbi:hypothetical protein T06_7136 [Trichinella sp. T6]|nr:hypothetical protein T06_7136 [Trichinella sp. T6]